MFRILEYSVAEGGRLILGLRPWEQDDKVSIPVSTTGFLGEHGQVPECLCLSFPSVGNDTFLLLSGAGALCL